MPIFEQGYRRYEGEVRRSSRSLAIAWESIRPRMRWWVWLLLFFFLFWPYLVFGAVTFFATMSPVFGSTAARVPPDTVFLRFGEPDPARILGMLSSGHGMLYWEVLADSMAVGFPVHLTAVAAAGLLASDRRAASLQLYFARPVSAHDYLAGKILAASAFAALMTAIPTLLLWIESALLSPDRGYVLDTWWMPFGILGASAQYALWCAAIVLFFSMVIDRPVFVALAAIFTFLFLHGVGWTLAAAVRSKELRIVSPHVALGGLTAPFFGLKTPDWLPLWRCVLVGFAAPVLLLAFVRWRLRAVEVVT